MNPHFFMGAYWPARKESIDQCADRVLEFLESLANCDRVFAKWYELGWTRKQAVERMTPVLSREYILKTLEKGQNRTDVGNEVIEEMGFDIGLWNGSEKTKSVGLHITCGLYWISPNEKSTLGNAVVLDLPDDLGELQQADHAVKVLAAAVESWEPAWAGIMSLDAMNKRGFNGASPFVDWMVFVTQKIGQVAAPSVVYEVPNHGSIIVVQPCPPSPDDPGALERIRKVEKALE